MSTGSRTRPLALADYPTGDGKPMGETPLHIGVMNRTWKVLEHRFGNDPSAYVSGNMMMYYVEGDKRRHVSPDVFVSFRVGNHYRDAYFVWVEGKGPDVVFEITSPSTRSDDVVKKRQLYQDVLKVPEYFLFDPRSEYLKPPLQGFRRGTDGLYHAIEPDAEGRLHSEVLDLWLQGDRRALRFFDPVTGQELHEALEEALIESNERMRDAVQKSRAEAKARRKAVRRARLEAAARREADDRARVEAAARREADDRARLESTARREADEYVRDLAERLRAATEEIERLRGNSRERP